MDLRAPMSGAKDAFYSRIMRIISGSAGGLALKVPRSLTRPTADRVREAIFSSLGGRIEGARVLDLYAGSGALGIEALSRGAASARFVDAAADACKVIAENLRTTRLEVGAEVRQGQVLGVLRALGTEEPFDLIFADPPYARSETETEELAALLNSPLLPALLAEGGCLVLETWAKPRTLPPTPLWTVQRDRAYGEARVSYLVPTLATAAAHP